MKEIFKESKQTLLVKIETSRVEEISLGFQNGLGRRMISDSGEIDYDFETVFQDDFNPGKNDQIKKIVSLAQKISQAAKNFHSSVKQVRVNAQIEKQNIEIDNSRNKVADFRQRYYLSVEVVAAQSGKLQKARQVVAGTGLIKIAHPELLGKIPAQRACLMLTAPEAPVGQMPVVIAGEAGGTMIHEACGHGLEADCIVRKISKYAGQLNQKVASEKITVIDDPTLAGHYGSYRYDDEGTKAQPVVLIEKGILKNYLADIYYSKILKIKANGHGRRQSFRTWPIPRMANTFVAKGNDDPREILRSLKKGIFVKKLGGGQVDIVSGDFVFEIEEGYLVVNGKIKHPVRRAILMGNGPEILKSCDAVGDDLEFIPGICGKDDHAPVTSGQPTLSIPEILIGGLSLN